MSPALTHSNINTFNPATADIATDVRVSLDDPSTVRRVLKWWTVASQWLETVSEGDWGSSSGNEHDGIVFGRPRIVAAGDGSVFLDATHTSACANALAASLVAAFPPNSGPRISTAEFDHATSAIVALAATQLPRGCFIEFAGGIKVGKDTTKGFGLLRPLDSIDDTTLVAKASRKYDDGFGDDQGLDADALLSLIYALYNPPDIEL
ncbi:hypothetical protein HK102_001148, partial [Quaeritorhiza haematococci]